MSTDINVSVSVDYFKSLTGLLKLAQLFIGIFCIGFSASSNWRTAQNEFYIVICATFFIGTFLMCLSALISTAWAKQHPAVVTSHEVIYHGFATFLLMIASIAAMVEMFIIHFVFGVINTLLYGASTFFAVKEGRGHFRTNITTTTQQTTATTTATKQTVRV